MKFATADVLGVTTGRLLADIGGIYKVISFLIGRDAYTHELLYYGRKAEAAIKSIRPDLPGSGDAEHVTQENYKQCLAEWEAKIGIEIDLPDSLRDCLVDEKNALETLNQMVDPNKVIVIGIDK